MSGGAIRELGHSFFEIAARAPFSARIPYHRVLRIEVDGDRYWTRRDTEK